MISSFRKLVTIAPTFPSTILPSEYKSCQIKTIIKANDNKRGYIISFSKKREKVSTHGINDFASKWKLFDSCYGHREDRANACEYSWINLHSSENLRRPISRWPRHCRAACKCYPNTQLYSDSRYKFRFSRWRLLVLSILGFQRRFSRRASPLRES